MTGLIIIIIVAMPVHGSSRREYGLLSEHHE